MHESFRSFDGIELAYRRRTAPDPPGETGPPVLLLHGFMASSDTTWGPSKVSGALHACGRSVIELDARGHGASARPHLPSAYGERAMARDVSALIDHLGLPAVVVVGSSLGGFTALEAALLDTRLQRVVAIGVGPVATTTETYRSWARSMVSEIAEPDDPFRAHVQHHGGDRRAYGAWLSGAMLPQLGSAAQLERLRQPVLVINGEQDPLDAENLAATVARGRALRVEGDHSSCLESPALVAAINAFVVAGGSS